MKPQRLTKSLILGMATQQLERGLVKRLEQLGHKVVLEPALCT
jgi:hypothetical protein